MEDKEIGMKLIVAIILAALVQAEQPLLIDQSKFSITTDKVYTFGVQDWPISILASSDDRVTVGYFGNDPSIYANVTRMFRELASDQANYATLIAHHVEIWQKGERVFPPKD